MVWPAIGLIFLFALFTAFATERLPPVTIAVFGAGSFVAQGGALLIVGVYTLGMTWALAKLVGLITPMRVDLEAETNGLDLSTHGERAYDMNS